jgi:hypothetical protein
MPPPPLLEVEAPLELMPVVVVSPEPVLELASPPPAPPLAA